MTVIEQAQRGDILVRLIERGISNFTILFEGGNIVGIVYRTTDRACAHEIFENWDELLKQGGAHPAWRGPVNVTRIHINQGS